MTKDNLDVIALIGLIVACVALFVAVFNLIRANKIGSAGAFVALYPQFPVAWYKVIEERGGGIR